MTSDRPYQPARSVDAALAELRRCTGTQFDPRVVAAFERVVLGALVPAPVAAAERAKLLA
jgi:HD-GYP domain-containing protein (c-di-GMP phosphodiesterase class II)